MLAVAVLVCVVIPRPGWQATLRDLDSRHWPTRQRAEADLRQRMSYWSALRLESDLRQLGPEGRARANRVLSDWWSARIPAEWHTLGFIDALNEQNRCQGPHSPLVQEYLDRACFSRAEVPHQQVTYPEYRYATYLLAQDLAKRRVPPSQIRSLLGVMARYSREWEVNRKMPPQTRLMD